MGKGIVPAQKAIPRARCNPVSRLFAYVCGLPAIAIRATITTLPLYCVPFMKIETKAVHIGRKAEAGSRDVTPVIHLSTTFQNADDVIPPAGYLDSPPNTPNHDALKHVLPARYDPSSG